MTGVLRVAVLSTLLALTAAPAGAAGAAHADKEGWWSQTGRVAPATLLQTVPEGAIAVAAAGGEVYAVAALGVVLDAEKGSIVERFTLTLKEAQESGAQQNAGAAIIVACPIVDFFAGDYDGAWEDAPAADCEAARSEGVRNDDGTWTFDLAPIADAWLDPFGTIAANGIRFDPGDASFQTSFTGMEDAVFDVSVSPPQEEDDPFDAVTTTVPGGFTGGASAPPADVVEPPPAVDAPETTAPVVEPETDEQAAGDELAEPASSRAGDVAGNLPAGVVLLLVALVGGAAAIALGLGPLGRQRATVSRRSGGVSRALESRTTTGART